VRIEGIEMQGRRLSLGKKIKDYDFISLSKKERHARTKIRLIGLAHLQEGKRFSEVAKILKVSWISVRNWLNRFKEGGLEALSEGKRSGRRSHLPQEKETLFKKDIIELQNNREGGRVIGKDIQKLLKKKYKANYELDSVYRLLERIGMVWISARSKHPKADDKKQEAFKKTLKKKSRKLYQKI